MPNLIVKGISEAINNNEKANLIYLCNIMTQSGETDGYDVDDHIDAIEKHLNGKIDQIIYPNNIIPKSIIENYKRENAEFVQLDLDKDRDYRVFIEDLICFKNGQARHCSEKIEEVFRKYMKVVK